jgi:hypothetical protein
MAKFIAFNNLKIKCNNIAFKECSIVFRKITPLKVPERILISNLVNPSYSIHKGKVICYCDTLIYVEVKPKVKKEKVVLEEYQEDIELEDPFPQYNIIEKMDLEEDIELIYKKEKLDWIHRFSKNQHLIDAVNADYDCDEEYCLERMSQEYPGFFMVDETTTCYKSHYPSNELLALEKRLTVQVNKLRSKYGTYTRIARLECHNHVDYNFEEAIVIFFYLNKFDIIGLKSVVEQYLNGKQLESGSNRS